MIPQNIQQEAHLFGMLITQTFITINVYFTTLDNLGRESVSLLFKNYLDFMRTLCKLCILFIFISCEKESNNEMGGIDFRYLPRVCEHATASHYYRIDMGTETGNSKFDNTYSIEQLSKQDIRVNDYLLNVQVGSFNDEMQASPDFNPDDYLTEKDLNMEQQIGQYLSRENAVSSYSNNHYVNLVEVEYRLTEAENIKISATEKLFGKEVGQSLNDKIEIFSTPSYHSFLFTYDKQLIGDIQQGWSLEKYLSHRPIASASLYLRFTSTPAEAPLETQFVVEMEMTNGDILRDTTETVNLLP